MVSVSRFSDFRCFCLCFTRHAFLSSRLSGFDHVVVVVVVAMMAWCADDYGVGGSNKESPLFISAELMVRNSLYIFGTSSTCVS